MWGSSTIHLVNLQEYSEQIVFVHEISTNHKSRLVDTFRIVFRVHVFVLFSCLILFNVSCKEWGFVLFEIFGQGVTIQQLKTRSTQNCHARALFAQQLFSMTQTHHQHTNVQPQA